MKSMCLTLAILLLSSASALAGGIYDDKRDGSLYNSAPPAEVTRLPKYCWGRYNPKLQGPKYNIDPRSCGPFTNHFCQGMLRFNRSQNPMASKAERAKYLKQSLGNFDYTLNGLKNYQGCFMRKHALIMQKRARIAASTPMP
jgi:hypothetical protein